MLPSLPLSKDIVRPPETILVNITPQETRVAILEENNICELHIERNSGHGLVGNIYLGVVRRVLPGMQSAFVDIGLERAAFLHIVDILEQRKNPEAAQRIEHVLFEGQTLLVQVIKDPINSKGARLSTQISLAGRFLVHLPQEEHIGVSQRIEDHEERHNLRGRLNSLLPPDSAHGYIIRTSAETATDAELQADIGYLTKVWQDIRSKAKTRPAGSLLYQDLPLSLRVLRDMFSGNTREILVDSKENFAKMQDFAAQYVQDAPEKIKLFNGERPLFETHNVEAEINRALQPRVSLNFGSYLIIEATEAMTTIDVNTGGFVGARNFDETIFKTNLEACHAIARELRLRNLGGIIMLDFIDMNDPEHQQGVMDALLTALAGDRSKYTISPISPLGIIEMTRKRTRESLRQLMCEPCPCCQGRGYVKTVETITYELFRDLMREARDFSPKMMTIVAGLELIDFIREEESLTFSDLQALLKIPIRLQVDSAYRHGQYDIALG